MAAAEGTDASVLAGAVAMSAAALCVAGLIALPNTTLALTGTTLIPLLLGAAGFLVMVLFVDPALTPRHRPRRVEIHIWLSKTVLYRLPVTEVPILSGVVVAFSTQERGALLTGLVGTLVLAAVWWPGEQYFNAMRRRLQPLSADRLLDEILSDTNGRLKLRTR